MNRINAPSALVAALAISAMHACAPSAASTTDPAASDASSTVQTATCALKIDESRAGATGTCGVHPASMALDSTCCSTNVGRCFPPTAQDIACARVTSADAGTVSEDAATSVVQPSADAGTTTAATDAATSVQTTSADASMDPTITADAATTPPPTSSPDVVTPDPTSTTDAATSAPVDAATTPPPITTDPDAGTPSVVDAGVTSSADADPPSIVDAATTTPVDAGTTTITDTGTTTVVDAGTTTVADAGSTTPTDAGTTTTTTSGPTIGGCAIFPADNEWNRDISADPVDPNSANYIASIGASTGMHPDYGSNTAYGIPYVVVPSTQPFVPITFQYASESDPGPYPIPANPPIEGGNDHHILIVQSDTCLLYEIYSAALNGSTWTGGSGAIWHLTQDWTRPLNWTSADEAGLPILPGLVRYDEVQSGQINHALRFTVSTPQGAFVSPASHATLGDSTNPNTPPMGLRFRLRASFDVTPYPASVQVILRALQRYGMFVADTGADWYISGATDSRWNDDEMHTLGTVLGSDFEVVAHGPIQYPQ